MFRVNINGNNHRIQIEGLRHLKEREKNVVKKSIYQVVTCLII